MQIYSNDHRGYNSDYYSVVEKELMFKDEYSYSNGSTMHMMKPPTEHCLPKHNYNQGHGQVYTGYNNNLDKKDHVAQEERRHDSWGGAKNDHYGHGGKMHQGGEHHHGEGMKHGGYGGAQGHFGHQKEGLKHGGGYGVDQGHGGCGVDQGHYGHHKEGMNHGGYGVDQGHYGHHREGISHGGYGGGYGADQGQYGHHREGMNHGGYGAHQGHYGPKQKVSVWEFKSIVD